MRKWQLESRVLVGLAVMVLATGLGAITMQRASQRTAVWQLDHALAAGTVLQAGDVHAAEVALDAADLTYAVTGVPVVGRALARDMGADELLPLVALTKPSERLHLVTVPMEALHLPLHLRRGERVDVWLSLRSADGTAGEAQRVLTAMRVDEVGGADASGRPAVVLAVRPSDVRTLISAVRLGDIDLVSLGAVSQ